jgi:hypothetical protein
VGATADRQTHKDVACLAACVGGLRRASKRSSASHELSVMTIDGPPMRMCFTAGHLARVVSRGSDGAGLACTQRSLTSARRTSCCRPWPGARRTFSPRRRATDWTAGQGSCCDLTVAACAGSRADRRGCDALIRALPAHRRNCKSTARRALSAEQTRTREESICARPRRAPVARCRRAALQVTRRAVR